MKIAQSLYLKKISRTEIAEYLDEIDQDEYMDTFENILKTKRKRIRAKDEYELNGKLVRFAMGRGFELNDIKRCISDIDYDD